MGLSGVLLTLVGVASAVSAIGALVQARRILQRRESAFETPAPAANRGVESRGAVNETEWIEEIAGKTNTPKAEAQRFFDAFTEVVTDSLKTGERVRITGKYYVQKRDRRQGIHIVSSESKVAEQLSEREIEVLRLLASGHTRPEIARNLHISTLTLRRRLRNIYGKLGAENYAEALDKARTAGLLR